MRKSRIDNDVYDFSGTDTVEILVSQLINSNKIKQIKRLGEIRYSILLVNDF